MQPLEVKVIRETGKNVVIKLIAVNRSFPVERTVFDERVKKGMYVII